MAFKEYVRSSQSRCEPMVGNAEVTVTAATSFQFARHPLRTAKSRQLLTQAIARALLSHN
jgi:hypothetical protein